MIELPVKFTVEVHDKDGDYTHVDLIVHAGEGDKAFTRRVLRQRVPLRTTGDALPEGVAAVALMEAFQRAFNPPPACPHLPAA